MENRKVIFISLISALGGLLFGFDTAVISGTIKMVAEQYTLGVDMQGWFVSSALVGCVIGVSLSGLLSDKIGRKKTLIAAALFFTASAVGCALSDSVTGLIIYRIVGGAGIGFASVLSPMYIAELSPAKYRGRLVALYQLAITIGILTAYFSNTALVNFFEAKNVDVWRWMFGAETAPAFLFLMLLFAIPESPRWLLVKGKKQRAERILKKYLPGEEAQEQLLNSSDSQEKIRLSQVFLNPSLLTLVIIGSMLAAFSQLSGINAIIYFGPDILSKAGLALGESLDGQVTIGIVNVVFTLLAIWKIDSWGRKPLLLSGITGVALSLIMCGAYFLFEMNSTVLIIAFIMFFIACFAFSYGPVTWIVISEIYPTKFRGFAMSIATMALWITNVLIAQFFPRLNAWSTAGSFFVFAIISILAFFFVRKYIPETKNKSLESIEKQMFHQNKTLS